MKTDALTETLSCAGLNGVREAGLTVLIVLLNSHPHPVFNPRYFLILEPYCGRVNVASNQLDRTVSVANKREVARKFGSKHKKKLENINMNKTQTEVFFSPHRVQLQKLHVAFTGTCCRMINWWHSWADKWCIVGMLLGYKECCIHGLFCWRVFLGITHHLWFSQFFSLNLGLSGAVFGPHVARGPRFEQPRINLISSFGPWVEDWVSEKPTRTKKD